MIGDPATAPKRTDLPFLRRRSRPPAASPPSAPAASAPAASAPAASAPAASGAPAKKIDFSRPDRRPATAQPSSSPLDLSPPSAPAPGAPAPKIDFSRPSRTTPAPPDRAPAAGPSSSSLDLSSTGTPASPEVDYRRPAPPSGSLDLSDAPSAPATPAAPRPARPAQRVHQDVRLSGREQRLLNVKAPTATLTRMQSGVGHLDIEAVCSADVGDLRLGAVYHLRSGGSSTVQHADGHRFAPPATRRPVIVATREEYERISLDLRQVRDIERIGIYAFSESRAELTWGGTLVVTTFGGGRVELPLETLYAGRIAMLMSIYNLDGELVIRAEMETIAGDVREAARAYGYDRITWRDDHSPVD